MRYYATSVALALLSVLSVAATHVCAFLPHRSTPLSGHATPNAIRSFISIQSDNRKEGSDIPREDEVIGEQYEGSVDWDDEWKKVVQNRDQPEERPGKYKSQAEIATIKATNKVAKNVYEASQEAKAKLPTAPSIRSLQGDWRFWIGILLIVSFGLSVLSATSQVPTNDSFYI